jgi:acetyl esterase/lipase
MVQHSRNLRSKSPAQSHSPPAATRVSPELFLPSALLVVIEFYVGCIVQFYFNIPIYVLKRIYNIFPHCAQDGYHQNDGLKIDRGVRYGPLADEVCDIIEPLSPSTKGTIINVHGGGFIAPSDEMYWNSVSFLARQGFTVVGLDYPLAPFSRYPTAIISVLRAIRFANAKFGTQTQDVYLFGDSAGANIVLIAAAATCNEHIMKQLDPENKLAIDPQRVPISGVISMYGMTSLSTCCDNLQDSLSQRFLHWGLRFVWHCFAGSAVHSMPPDFDTMLSSESIKHFPPAFFCVGNKDFLLRDTLLTCKRMTGRGLRAEMRIYEGDHAFFGLPLDWQYPLLGWDAKHSIACASDIMQFLSRNTRKAQDGYGFRGFAGTVQPRKDPWQPIMWLVALNIVLIPVTAVLIPVCLAVSAMRLVG